MNNGQETADMARDEKMTSRERVRAILEGKESDRAAVVCPGGMMSLAVTEVMDATGMSWPRAHAEGETMKGLSLAMQEATGFDNLAAPFCMTVEAEAYGAEVELGDRTRHPRVKRSIMQAGETGRLPTPRFEEGRARTLVEVIRELRKERPDLAVVGNVVGPFSLLGSLWDALTLLKAARRRPETVEGPLDEVTEELAGFAARQVEAGADAVCIAEPTATGEILGGELFGRLVSPRLGRIARRVREAGGKVIVHICGDARGTMGELARLEAEAVSFDSMVDIVGVAGSGMGWQAMGNVDAFLLERGPEEVIRRRCEGLRKGGVRLIAPACGVVTTTPVRHLRAMRRSAEAH